MFTEILQPLSQVLGLEACATVSGFLKREMYSLLLNYIMYVCSSEFMCVVCMQEPLEARLGGIGVLEGC